MTGSAILFYGLLLAMGATVVSLVLGLFSFFKGGEKSSENSNRFMRWRIVFQGIAIALFTLLLMNKH